VRNSPNSGSRNMQKRSRGSENPRRDRAKKEKIWGERRDERV
jgi:hypothetical protein